MKRLGAYISSRADTWASSPYLTKGCFVYYEYVSDPYGDLLPQVHIWRLDVKLNQGPDEIILLKSPDELKKHIEPREAWAKHYISYRNTSYRIQNMACRCVKNMDIEVIDELTVKSIDAHETWEHDNSSAYQFLKEAKLVDFDIKTRIDYTRKRSIASFNDLVMPVTVKEELKKSLEQDVMKSALNSCRGGFTTTNDFISNRVLSVNEALEIWENKNKETKTMEKKKMTVTDLFLKNLNGITITSTYSRLDHVCAQPYYIYYPEMEITEDIADTLLTVLLMAKRDYIKKVVFNPEKGTTAIARHLDSNPVTVRCRDGEFDYILGYEMARSKMYFGSNDYNWFNKIKNHRKTHIEYTEKKPTEPKAKRTSKKGGKK